MPDKDYRFRSPKTIASLDDSHRVPCHSRSIRYEQFHGRSEAAMARSPCVVLYGNSIFLDAIRAGLKDVRVKLVTVEPAGPGATRLITAHHPAAVIFDRCLAEPDFTLALLEEQPDLILIGVDPSSNKVFVLSGREEQPASPAELLRALLGWVVRPATPHR